MKATALFVLTLTLLGVSYADEETKALTMNFWQCMFCHEDPIVQEEMIKCKKMKPEKSEKIVNDCRDEILPGLETIVDRWPYFCKNENQERERFHDCMEKHEIKKNYDDDDKSKMKEFRKCLQKIQDKFCSHH